MNQAEKDIQGVTRENVDHKEIDVKEIIQVILRRKTGVFIIILVSLISSILFYFYERPEYYSSAVVMINEQPGTKDIVSAVLNVGPAADSKVAQKDVELLKSLPISEMVVRKIWSTTKKDSLELFDNKPYISPARYLFNWLIPVKNRRVQNSNIQPNTPMYDEMMRMYAMRFQKRIRIISSINTSILNISVQSPFPDESTYLTNILCEEYKKFDIQRNSERYVQSNRFVTQMLKEQEDNLIKADNALSKFMIENKIYEVTGNTGLLLGRLIEIEARYKDISAEFKITKNSLEYLDKKLSDNDRQVSAKVLRAVNEQLGTIQDEIRAKESEYMTLLREKGVSDESVLLKKQELEQIKNRYENISRSKIAGQIGYIGSTQKIKYDLITEKLKMEQKLNQLSFSENEYKKLREYYEDQLDALPKKEQSFVRLARDRDVVSKTYLFLKEKLDDSRILIGSEVGSVTVVGAAFQPFMPESPDLMRNILMGSVLGVLAGALYVLVAENLDDRINYDLSFFKSLGFNIWGVIPLIPSFNSNTNKSVFEYIIVRFKNAINVITKKNKDDKNISQEKEKNVNNLDPYPVMTDKLNSVFAESFRTLRTNLAFARIDRPIKSVVVSGCSVGEGKSTVSANLAMSWAIADKKTIIIDADLRRPVQHNVFKKSRALGLTDCLVNNDLEINDRYIQKTHIDNLFLISAGSPVPNPNELLGSDRMKTLIENLALKYDRIIIDSPPVFISDAAQLLGVIDGVLLSVRLGYSSKYTLRQYAFDSFIYSHIIGLVLIDNERPTKGLSASGYGRFGYSRYGYSEYGNSYMKE